MEMDMQKLIGGAPAEDVAISRRLPLWRNHRRGNLFSADLIGYFNRALKGFTSRDETVTNK